MSDVSSNNKRIAKNTLLLYVRTIITMLISLYTSRVILAALGETDYGIYNVVGGVVAMFSVISSSLSAAISRFITYEMGKGNIDKLNTVFSSAMSIQIALSLIILILAETIGLWFLNTQLNIPDERMVAANWVFQFSIATFIIHLLYLPYHASIIAHERMSAFAYISIFEAIGKLIVAFLIVTSPIDRLIFYAAFMGGITVVVWLVYKMYCNCNFYECRYSLIWDSLLLRQMFSFAGWNFIGASSAVLRDQGGNIVINLFCGPVVNAARGIAFQVNTAITSFIGNFTTALNPQITKSYAAGNHEYMMRLLFQGARLSFYMLLILSLPVLINTEFILGLWLKEVPRHTSLFLQLVLVYAMAESISSPLTTAMLATGKIRNYQILVGGLQMMNLPISYICLRMGCIPETVLIVAIIISQMCLIARLYMLRDMIKLKVRLFIQKVYFNIIIVSIAAALLPIVMSIYFTSNWWSFICSNLLCLICTIISVLYIGCNKMERSFIYDKSKIVITKFKSIIKL